MGGKQAQPVSVVYEYSTRLPKTPSSCSQDLSYQEDGPNPISYERKRRHTIGQGSCCGMGLTREEGEGRWPGRQQLESTV